MAKIPLYCGRHGCKKPIGKYVGEDDETYFFTCLTCGCMQAVTKDHIRNRVAYEKELARLGKTVTHSWDKPVLYSFGK